MPHQPRNRSHRAHSRLARSGSATCAGTGLLLGAVDAFPTRRDMAFEKKVADSVAEKNSFRFFFVPPHFLPRSVGTQCGGSTYVAGAVAFTRGVRYILSEAAAHLRSPIIVRLHGAAADQPALRYPDAHPTQMTTRRGPTAGGRIKGGPFLAARFTPLVCVGLNLKGGIPKGVVAFCLLSYWRWSPQMRTLSYEMFFFLWGLWI